MFEFLVVALLVLLNVQVWRLGSGMNAESLDMAQRHQQLLEALDHDDDD